MSQYLQHLHGLTPYNAELKAVTGKFRELFGPHTGNKFDLELGHNPGQGYCIVPLKRSCNKGHVYKAF